MSDSRFVGKVGFFVAVGIILLALLLMSFSKGLSLFTPTYELRLKAASVGGLKNAAAVLMSGVTVGNVVDAQIPSDSKGVILRLKIQERFKIHADARFAIEQIGFLGDQYVAIYPQKNEAPILKSGDVVTAEEPLNIQEIVRSAAGLMQGVTQTLKVLNEAVSRVDRTVLSDHTLSNVTTTLGNFRIVSERAVAMIDGVSRIVETNSNPISISVSNLVRFSAELDNLAGEMQLTVATNRIELTKAVKNLERTTAVLERLATDVESGKGLAGTLIKDQQLQLNLSVAMANLATLSSNLNRYGLLYKPKPPKNEESLKPLFPGRTPFK